jgi:GNAT superfamily N-acetyltransferase
MSLSIRPVQGRADLKRFIEFPWQIYRGDPNWVPPLKADVSKLLTPGQHPFHEHAEVQPFLALRDGKVVGRVVAHVNRAHNEYHGDKAGFFGFHDALREDEEASASLFAEAFSWLKERGRSHALGPFELSTNESCGLLVEGEPGPPVIMMNYNPDWYPERYEAVGLSKAKDLLAFKVRRSEELERLLALAEKLMKRHGVRLRKLDMKDFSSEVDRILALYNRCWEKNWGFVPMSEAEVRHFASELRYGIDPDVVFFLEDAKSGEAHGFILALPDLNVALKEANGRLFPFGLLKILWHKRKIDGIRVVTLGIVPEMRGRGLDGVLIQAVVKAGLAKGYEWAECSWVLEDNLPMIVPLQKFAGEPYRTYRIYQKEL